MNVLSLFDGISCGRVALDRANIPYKNYFASEIDKYAIKIAQKNYPDTTQLGDIQFITGQQFDAIGGIDLLIGGSPCQGFSFAGKQLNFDDPRSALFFEFVRLLKECNPKYFLLENVKMKKEYQDVISNYLGVEPIEINSALVSAQNRKRLYWTNIPNIEQPPDKNILLKDIIQNNLVDRDKSYCIDANCYKGGNLDQYFNKFRRQLVFLNEVELLRAKEKYKSKIWKSGNRRGNMQFPDRVERKSKCLTSTIIKGARETIHIEDKAGIRILTPIECERLQTLPDNYTEGVSNTQRYKALGNGWTVDVIAHIFKHIP
jgi:DNA-cytosine methyltransferase